MPPLVPPPPPPMPPPEPPPIALPLPEPVWDGRTLHGLPEFATEDREGKVDDDDFALRDEFSNNLLDASDC